LIIKKAGLNDQSKVNPTGVSVNTNQYNPIANLGTMPSQTARQHERSAVWRCLGRHEWYVPLPQNRLPIRRSQTAETHTLGGIAQEHERLSKLGVVQANTASP
jgi:hypothetical protein